MTTTVDETQESESIGLSPLTLDDVRNFFDTYIRPYAPYREEKVYDTLINNLMEYYYNQTYLNIPSELKTIFEEGNIEVPTVYDQLLIAVGVPSEIINNISMANKIIFLKTLSDFERYKGTVSFFQKVAESYSDTDRFSIYELFIDFDGTNWVFKPVNLYLHDDMSLNTASILYSTVYDTIPSLLLSEEQLTTLYEDEKLVLPIKSNLMLLDSDLATDVSLLYDVIVAVFLHTYKDNYVEIYFKDTSQAVQIKTLYYLWYYLLTRYYGTTWASIGPFTMKLLKFVYDDSLVIPLTIDNLHELVEEYDDIVIVNSTNRDYDNTRTLRDALYVKIAGMFAYDYIDPTTPMTVTDLYNELMVQNSLLTLYITDRLANTSIGEQSEINLILKEIYASLELYASTYTGDTYYAQYSDYFLKYLPQVLINPESTVTYTILYNLKPYHVELYNKYISDIRCQDKFNQICIDDEQDIRFQSTISFASALDFSVDAFFEFIKVAESPIAVRSAVDEIVVNSVYEDTETPTELYPTEFIYPIGSVLTISNDCSHEFDKDLESNIACRDSYEVTKVP